MVRTESTLTIIHTQSAFVKHFFQKKEKKMNFYAITSEFNPFHTGHKYLCIFCLFREVHHTSSPDFGVTKFPAVFHPNCQPSAKPVATAPSLWCKSHIWPFLLPTSCTAVKFCLLQEFSFIIVLQGCPRKRLLC